MTYHIRCKNYKCPKCSANYIPFKKDFKCPNCGESTNEFFDLIPEMVHSLEYHKQKYGSFRSPAWSITSFVEHIQSIMFDVFDYVESNKLSNPEVFIAEHFDKADWGDKPYLKNHVKEIALVTLKNYRAKGNKFRASIKAEIDMLDKIIKETREKKSWKGFWKRMWIP